MLCQRLTKGTKGTNFAPFEFNFSSISSTANGSRRSFVPDNAFRFSSSHSYINTHTHRRRPHFRTPSDQLSAPLSRSALPSCLSICYSRIVLSAILTGPFFPTGRRCKSIFQTTSFCFLLFLHSIFHTFLLCVSVSLFSTRYKTYKQFPPVLGFPFPTNAYNSCALVLCHSIVLPLCLLAFGTTVRFCFPPHLLGLLPFSLPLPSPPPSVTPLGLVSRQLARSSVFVAHLSVLAGVPDRIAR